MGDDIEVPSPFLPRASSLLYGDDTQLPTNILYNASILLLNEKRSKEIESFSFHTFDNDVFCPVFCLEFVHLNKLGLSTKQTLQSNGILSLFLRTLLLA